MATRVLIIGGLGFYGRHLFTYLIENNLADVKIVDKQLPQTAYLNQRHRAAFEKCKYTQGNLLNPRYDGADIIVNCSASEIRVGQHNELYERDVITAQVNWATAVSKLPHKAYVMISTPDVYSGNKLAPEDSPKPGHSCGKYFLQAEEKVKAIPNLNLVILRPAITYGPGATSSLMTLMCLARLAEFKKEKLTLPGKDSYKVHTVHVQDLVRAIWHVANNPKPGVTYNVVDQGDTTQRDYAQAMSSLFSVETEFLGIVMTWVAQKITNSEIADHVNDEALGPWAELLQKANISNSPISPWIEADQVNMMSLAMDGSRFVKETGFSFDYPKFSIEKMKEMLQDARTLGIFP